MKFKKGFTLIELLVVIAIIGVLSSVVLASLNTARAKARDAKRMSEIKQLITAIEMYFTTNGVYPPCSGGNNGCASNFPIHNLTTMNLVPTYIGNVPEDPINTIGQYGYYYARGYKPAGPTSVTNTFSDQNFIVGTRLENSSKPTYVGWGNNNLNVLLGQ